MKRFLETLLCETLFSIRENIYIVWFLSVLGRFWRCFALLFFNQLNKFIFNPITIYYRFRFFFLLHKQNQSMRGNGRKQYQDSPNQKKRTNGVHSQPAKQQNLLMVRVIALMLRKQFTSFEGGARALARHIELLYWQDFFEANCIVHLLKILGCFQLYRLVKLIHLHI